MNKLLSVFCMSALVVLMCRADTWYVATNGNDSVAGTNWDTALRTISNGIARAQSGHVVLVSNGVYVVTQQLNVSKPVVLTSLFGRAETIIAGNGATRVLLINHSNAVVSGFTISNGNAGVALRGGGVMIDVSGGILNNCRITGNTARYGGGVYVETQTGRVENCIMDGNITTEEVNNGGGGGIYMRYGGNVVGCQIFSNRGFGGGGIYIEANGCVSNCIIRANSSDFAGTWTGGGGIFINSAGTVAHCEIAENETTKDGAGIYSYYGAAPDGLRIEHCLITSNRITGAMPPPTQYRYGGGIYLRGEASNVVVRNCLLAYNSAPYGGGVYMNARSNLLINCTIVSNTAYNTSGAGGAFVAYAGQLLNCIVYNNTAPSKPNLSCFGGGLTGGVAYSCSFPVEDMGAGAGNLTNQPLFDASGTFRLQSGSPCINTGTNLEWMADAMDLDGRPRLDRFSRKVDMGAYEFLPNGMLFMGR